jgi:chromosome partitioning protein
MILSVVNHKGGAGKTTTTINLGAALAADGYSVLLIDFDAQGSLSYSLGAEDGIPTIADALLGEASLDDVLITREGLSVLPASSSLADVELAIAKADDRFHHLRDLIRNLPSFDFILIDCPPSLSLLTVNALVASDRVLIPMQLDVLSLRGLDMMLDTVQRISSLNTALTVMGVLPVMVDPRKNINKEILAHLQTNYSLNIFTQTIRSSVKAAEAPSFGKSVLNYAPGSTTSADFRALAKEVAALTEQKITQN